MWDIYVFSETRCDGSNKKWYDDDIECWMNFDKCGNDDEILYMDILTKTKMSRRLISYYFLSEDLLTVATEYDDHYRIFQSSIYEYRWREKASSSRSPSRRQIKFGILTLRDALLRAYLTLRFFRSWIHRKIEIGMRSTRKSHWSIEKTSSWRSQIFMWSPTSLSEEESRCQILKISWNLIS